MLVKPARVLYRSPRPRPALFIECTSIRLTLWLPPATVLALYEVISLVKLTTVGCPGSCSSRSWHKASNEGHVGLLGIAIGSGVDCTADTAISMRAGGRGEGDTAPESSPNSALCRGYDGTRDCWYSAIDTPRHVGAIAVLAEGAPLRGSVGAKECRTTKELRFF